MGCLRLRGTARSVDVVKLLHDQAWHIKNQGRFWMFMEDQHGGVCLEPNPKMCFYLDPQPQGASQIPWSNIQMIHMLHS